MMMHNHIHNNINTHYFIIHQSMRPIIGWVLIVV